MLEKIFASSLITIFVATGMHAPSQAATVAKPAVLLTKLKVQPESGSNTYKHSYFKHWIDADHDGCDTRAEVLIAERLAKVVQQRTNANKCKIVSGSWESVYDLRPFTTPAKMQIDHMVPLKEAWDSGALRWSAATRMNYANDLGYPHTLIAVTGTLNGSKGERDPGVGSGHWMPPSAAFACQYVGRWVAVKYRWSLSVDPAEKSFLTKKLKSCGSKANVAMPAKMKIVFSKAPTANSSAGSGVVPSSGGNDPRYSSCTKAKAAGYGPYRKGIDPEYSWYTDRDKDGIACE